MQQVRPLYGHVTCTSLINFTTFDGLRFFTALSYDVRISLHLFFPMKKETAEWWPHSGISCETSSLCSVQDGTAHCPFTSDILRLFFPPWHVYRGPPHRKNNYFIARKRTHRRTNIFLFPNASRESGKSEVHLFSPIGLVYLPFQWRCVATIRFPVLTALMAAVNERQFFLDPGGNKI